MAVFDEVPAHIVLSRSHTTHFTFLPFHEAGFLNKLHQSEIQGHFFTMFWDKVDAKRGTHVDTADISKRNPNAWNPGLRSISR